ncbi:AIP3-domain-containing protein [Xylona heveae TC161]|uniref:AIP3-domain-containing protein n=1 Tax=Xylona heveae (strain CBS 132557 / TC161) TaxID=1328760 RepID=A0A165IYX3_XYLHT|nr:AIP3-domain-containing protein [Xylona heveae TC161]KZF25566.1 AIP3-domain-containing protein [Xylona heveae TC161]
MHAPQASQRSMQRPSPVPEDGASANALLASAIDQRNSSASTRSSTNRRPNPSPQLSQIEKSVTHLLVATKQLLETLTQWSRKTASESEVSDVYVRLGYEFNIACRTFTTIGVETSDLGPVPDLLRSILEETLSQEASPESLDRYLPRIRDIIINLLHGLKRKQQRLRQRSAREQGTLNHSASSRQGSVGSTGSGELAHGADDGTSQGRTSSRRYGSGGVPDEHAFPPRTSSTTAGGRASPVRSESFNTLNGEARPSSSSRPHPPTHQSRPSNVMQNVPALPPNMSSSEQTARAMRESVDISSFTPPPPPPKQQDAFATLQRSGELERRASRRYSQYQISKHLGASPGGVPMLPPTQHSPVPNRGRDVRESINAVRTRASFRQRSANRLQGDVSPSRLSGVPRKISEEASHASQPVSHSPERSDASPSPERKLLRDAPSEDDDVPVMRATLQRPPTDLGAIQAIAQAEANLTAGSQALSSEESSEQLSPPQGEPNAPSTPVQSQQFVPDQSPQPGKELTLFLQYKSNVKKFVLPGGSSDLSIARLQLAFIEKFAWNTHSNGIDLPEIYIQDPVSGVRHELEDLADVKDRSVLVLNVEALDEVKRHIDDGLGGLRRMMEGMRSVVDEQAIALQRVSDRQQAAAKDMASLAAAPPAPSNRASKVSIAPVNGVQGKPSVDRTAQVDEIQSLRRDLAVVRQTFSGFVSDIEGSMTAVRTKANNIKTNASAAAIPPMSAESGRSYVNAGKKSLGDDSERIVNRVDDLQDMVEDLRKDVVSRGVRPLPRQLDAAGKEISVATKELRKMQEFLKREKPIWTKIWEKELELVCNDRDLLTMQEELVADLEDDLEKLTETFGLVEEATKQQNVQQGGRLTPRSLSNVALDQDVDPVKAKDGVLDEVRALQPNHETRLEAIERAEKARQKELESRRGGEFQRELGSFVEEGRLKKSGGVEEAERLRKAKDERIRREVWEKQNKRAMAEDAPGEQSMATHQDAAAAIEPEGATELPPPYDENGGVTSPEPEFADAKEEPVITDSDENGEAGAGSGKNVEATFNERDASAQSEQPKGDDSSVADDESVPEHERALI